MTRRELLAARARRLRPVCGARALGQIAHQRHHGRDRESTDESIAFAHHYGLQFIEFRNPPGSKKEYFTLTEPEIKADAIRFQKEGLKVSFLNTSLLKFAWPGMEPVRKRPEEPEAREKRLAGEKERWDQRMDDLHKAIRCAQIMGCDKVRVFAGARVEDPKTTYQRIAETVGEMSLTAEREKVYLLIENEGSQNIATSAELADIMKLIPSKWVGMNWDPHNAYGKETSYPDGYDAAAKEPDAQYSDQGQGRDAGKPGKRGLDGRS